MRIHDLRRTRHEKAKVDPRSRRSELISGVNTSVDADAAQLHRCAHNVKNLLIDFRQKRRDNPPRK